MELFRKRSMRKNLAIGLAPVRKPVNSTSREKVISCVVFKISFEVSLKQEQLPATVAVLAHLLKDVMAPHSGQSSQLLVEANSGDRASFQHVRRHVT
jgi:hypothetical protein